MRLEFPQQTFRSFVADLQPSDLVITASGRLARELRQRMAASRATSDDDAVLSAASKSTLLPTVLPYTAWLQDCWQRLRVEVALRVGSQSVQLQLLSEAQEEALWQGTLRAEGDADRFLFLDETIAACRRSHELTVAFRLPSDHASWQRSEESSLFLHWLGAAQQLCSERGWLLQADFPEAVRARLRDLPGSWARRVFLAGFDEPTPQQVAVFQELAAHTTSLAVLAGDTTDAVLPEVLECVAAADAESEWLLAAQWARQQTRANPQGRFAVVIPELAEVSHRVEEVFTAVFDEDAPWSVGAIRRAGFHISYAPPLAQNGLVAAGLKLLEALDGQPSVALLCYLLRSPCLAGAQQEWEARAAWEAVLLNARHDPMPLERARALTAELDASASLAVWFDVLAALAAARRSIGDTPERSPSRWVAFVRALWRALLWQGPPSLTSEEYQARHRAYEELGALAQLDIVVPACTFTEFLRRLQRHLASVSFQPETQPAAVLVAGLFEVSGLSFDAVWVCGLSDAVLPRPLAPDPFIPLELQRQLGLPRASTPREQAFAQGQFERLLRLAPRLVLSYPRRLGQQEQEPSPLLRRLGLPFREESPALPVTAGGEPQVDAEALPDWYGTGIPQSPDPQENLVPLRGGVRVFADQSACPFRAYAAGRLDSDALAGRVPLMDPRDQGSILHRALERFWRQTESRAALCALDDDQRLARVSQCVDDTVAEFLPRVEDPLAQAQKLAEAERLKSLLLAWLEEEQAREPFTVEVLERSQQVALEGFAMRLRPDRVDRLADGSLALIDYKSGEVSTKNWLGDRPREPQLLLYLASQPDDVSAIAFASMRAGSRGWKLFAKAEGELFKSALRKQSASPPDGWDHFVDQSRAAVTSLIRQFREGFAAVHPLHPQRQTCQYCVQQPFCRIGESLGANLPADEDYSDHMEGGDA